MIQSTKASTMFLLLSLYAITLLLLLSLNIQSTDATSRRSLRQKSTTTTTTITHRRELKEDDNDEGNWFGDLVDNIIQGGDENDTQSDGILDGGFLDTIINGFNNTDNESDGIFDGGFLDDILNGKNDTESADDDNNDTTSDEDGSGILQDVIDSIKNVTNNIIESLNNKTDDMFDGLNFTFDGNFSNGIFDGNFSNGIFDGNFSNGIFDGNFSNGIFDGDLFNFTDGEGILDGLFNFTEDGNGFFDNLFNNTNELFNETKKVSIVLSPIFMEQWLNDVAFDDTVCENDDDVPECFNSTGSVGFWTCRTLTNPFTGKLTSESICIGEGEYVPTIDTCGCCEDNCPQVQCECPCELPSFGSDDGTNTTTGVLVTVETMFGTNITNCVDPRYAVSFVGRSQKITCDDSCKTD